MVNTLIRYVVLGAIRDRFLITLIAAFILSAALSVFFGSVATIDKSRFSLVFLASSLRIVGVTGIILFVSSFIRRSFDALDVEYLLTRPVSRAQLVLSYGAGFAFIAAVLTVIEIFALGIAVSFKVDTGLILWGLGLWGENTMMAMAALFFAMVISSAATASMATLAFYILARMIGQIISIIEHTPSYGVFDALETVMNVISVFLPRLDLVSQSSWLLYGVSDISHEWLFPVVQSGVYIAVLLSATIFDLKGKDF